MKVLMTGAGGKIGSVLRAGLAGRYECLRLLDKVDIGDAREGEEIVVGDLGDPAVAARAVEGIDVVLHLAGLSVEGPWEEIVPANVTAPVVLFEAARAAGASRIVFASSIHVVGYYGSDDDVGTSQPLRPDSRYGVSKVFGEALCRFLSEKYGLSTIALRIGAFRPKPGNMRELSMWQSPGDMVRLAVAAIEAPEIGHAVVYGVSANTRRRFHDDAARSIGYVPIDNAEDYAAEILAGGDGEASARWPYHGGVFCALD